VILDASDARRAARKVLETPPAELPRR
jgi:hypothetical protein